MNLTLVRFSYGLDATLGHLFAGALNLATLEEPWRVDPDGPGGQRRESGQAESCVPDGEYLLHPHVSDKYPQGVWALVNHGLGVYYQDRPEHQAWGRSAVLIHSGNTTDDTEGCILVGLHHAQAEGRPQVIESRIAIARLRALLGRDTHQLLIRPTTGTSEAA